MFSKRARVDTDDLEDVRLRRSSNNTQLRRLIHEQLAMLNTSELSTHDRLQSIIAEQRTWLETPECDDVENTQVIDDVENIGDIESRQTGSGVQSNYNPQLPDMGLSRTDIQSLTHDGGYAGEFTVIPRRRFNGVEIIRPLNLRGAATNDLAEYNILLHNILNEIVDFSQLLAGETGYVNIALSGDSLPTAINAVLTPENNHDASIFTDQIVRAAQSNTDVSTDSTLTLQVSVAMDTPSGGRRRLKDIAISDAI